MSDPHPDHQTRFLLANAGVRGVAVRLRQSWRDLQSHAHYRDATAALLGQACAAAALFTGHAKVDGRLSLQLRSSHSLRTMFAECTAQGTVRGIVQLSEGSDAPADLRELGADALLAITIENPGLDPREPHRYQSLVQMGEPTLSAALENYFEQSEQLPTRLLLAAGREGASGLMLQKLPGDEGDLEGWTRAGALFDTLGAAELARLPTDKLLHRLFHEEQVEVLARKSLAFGCSCSRARVSAMLQSLGPQEARAALTEGVAEVRCEFCGQRYLFDPGQIEELFTPHPLQSSAPDRLQ